MLNSDAVLAAPAASVSRAEWQKTLFAARPTRRSLAGLAAQWPLRTVRIRIFRNTPVEFVLERIEPFLAFAELAAEFEIGPYDDALSQLPPGDFDAEIVWLDYARYAALAPAEIAHWVADRAAALRRGNAAPILVLDSDEQDARATELNRALEASLAGLPGTSLLERSAIAAALGRDYRDRRLASIAGTTVSDGAFTALARALGLRWIPAAVAPPLKALALDLDQTLYEGVLGEDGVFGVRLTETHRALQARIAALAADGVLIGIVSKNRPEDVEQLFGLRADFPLKRDMVAAWAVGWSGKAAGIERIAKELRIGTDAILFVDDNLGEIAAVSSAMPAVKTLYAASPAETLAGLEHMPGLLRWHVDATDRLRTKDLQAAAARDALKEGARDSADYYRSLDIRLAYDFDNAALLKRMADLSVKTNQFNLALRRFTEAEVARLMADPEARAVAVSLKDRLSDSGNVAFLAFRRAGDVLRCEDLCVSCRALGRDIEDLLIAAAVAEVRRALPAARVEFAYAAGPRNEPARNWAEKFAGVPLEGVGGMLALPEEALRTALRAAAHVALEGVGP